MKREDVKLEKASEVPHRKNAAEWVMWIVLWPVAWVMRKLGIDR